MFILVKNFTAIMNNDYNERYQPVPSMFVVTKLFSSFILIVFCYSYFIYSFTDWHIIKSVNNELERIYIRSYILGRSHLNLLFEDK